MLSCSANTGSAATSYRLESNKHFIHRAAKRKSGPQRPYSPPRSLSFIESCPKSARTDYSSFSLAISDFSVLQRRNRHQSLPRPPLLESIRALQYLPSLVPGALQLLEAVFYNLWSYCMHFWDLFAPESCSRCLSFRWTGPLIRHFRRAQKVSKAAHLNYRESPSYSSFQSLQVRSEPPNSRMFALWSSVSTVCHWLYCSVWTTLFFAYWWHYSASRSCWKIRLSQSLVRSVEDSALVCFCTIEEPGRAIPPPSASHFHRACHLPRRGQPHLWPLQFPCTSRHQLECPAPRRLRHQ